MEPEDMDKDRAHATPLKRKLQPQAISGAFSMASFYLEEVLYKEALAGIFQSFTGQSYEVADTECGCTEQLSLVMAAKKGAELCTQKKTTFSEK